MENIGKYDKEKLYDVIIIGGGPAGLTASLYLARAKYRVLVLEKEQFGGQITITNEVVNYPGIKRISGKELTDTIKAQAEGFGAEFLLARALKINAENEIKAVSTDKGDYYCFGILIATGAHPRTVGFKGEEEYKGHGVAYCATCDGEFFSGKEVFVIGGGFAAAEESVFLTKFASHVTIIMRGEDFSCAASVAEGAKSHEKISIITSTVVEEVAGDGGLNYIRYKNTKTGELTEYRAKSGEDFGVFVFAGYAPDTDIGGDLPELNGQGYIITDSQQKTNIDGVYAAGDVCIKQLRQIVTATGDGAIAATELEKYVARLHEKTGLAPKEAEKKKSEQQSESAGTGELFENDVKENLKSIFSKLEKKALFKLYLDKREVSRELQRYIEELTSLSEMLRYEIADSDADSRIAPCVRICLENGEETGLSFHGVPGGHEFTSFVLGIYNAIGPGQKIEPQTEEKIRNINSKTSIKVLVTLSCTMCPETVIASQLIASKNRSVSADIYDIRHFKELQKQYNVMSVPCIVVNDSKVSFGKKNIDEIVSFITQE